METMDLLFPKTAAPSLGGVEIVKLNQETLPGAGWTAILEATTASVNIGQQADYFNRFLGQAMNYRLQAWIATVGKDIVAAAVASISLHGLPQERELRVYVLAEVGGVAVPDGALEKLVDALRGYAKERCCTRIIAESTAPKAAEILRALGGAIAPSTCSLEIALHWRQPRLDTVPAGIGNPL